MCTQKLFFCKVNRKEKPCKGRNKKMAKKDDSHKEYKKDKICEQTHFVEIANMAKATRRLNAVMQNLLFL